MSEKKLKCNECGEMCFSIAYKGPNDTYLCGRDKGIKSIGICGNNVCFKCGKVETRTTWVKSYNCHGEFMEEVKVSMFSQFEKEKWPTDLRLVASYCDEHKEEAKKSPYKWTAEDDERLASKQKEKEVREEQEREEKLNNTKNLFYFLEQVQDKSGQFYLAFLEIRSGQKNYLMVPWEHSAWNSNDPTVKRLKDSWFYGEKMLLLIHGVENVPIEKSSPNYWKIWGRDTTKPIFHKIMGLNDKIAIAEYKENIDNPVFNDKVPSYRDGKKVLLIVGGITGTLIIVVIIRLLLKRKNKI